jgi:hypothetical protein
VRPKARPRGGGLGDGEHDWGRIPRLRDAWLRRMWRHRLHDALRQRPTRPPRDYHLHTLRGPGRSLRVRLRAFTPRNCESISECGMSGIGGTSDTSCGTFKKSDRVQVRWASGLVRDGYVKRSFRSGSYTVILDKPLSTGRQTHCQPEEVFAPAQDGLFARSPGEGTSQ